MALIVISFGLTNCWPHGLILLGWTVFLISLSMIGANQCQSSTSDRNLPIEAAEVVVQPGIEVSQPEDLSVKDTSNPKPGPSNKTSETSLRTRFEDLLDRVKAKVTDNLSESSWRSRIEEIRGQVSEQESRILKWLGETADLPAEKVEKDSRKLPDGMTRITIEKAISAPERYFSCKSADGTRLGRPLYTVYLGEDAVFGYSSFELQPNAETRLHKLGELLRLSEKKEIFISGHADRSGLSDKNETLSQRRAEIIANWLVHTGYLDQQNVQVRGEGDRVPYIATDQAEPLNRRVEVRVDCERKRTATSLSYQIRNLVWG
jgi:outer membrane protein OmpA-like peptidoglycan-associated protein